jgi:predicted MFS family arabinose efflux permease
MLSFGAGRPTGALAGGALSETFGPRAAIVTSTGLIVVAAVVARLSPLRLAGVR